MTFKVVQLGANKIIKISATQTVKFYDGGKTVLWMILNRLILFFNDFCGCY